MDKKYLHKVIDQLVSETELDYDNEKILFPFLSPHLPSLAFPPFFFPFSFFSSLTPFLPSGHFFLIFNQLSSRTFSKSFYNHCKNIYGLSDQEVLYVWDEYKTIIENKIKNGL